MYLPAGMRNYIHVTLRGFLKRFLIMSIFCKIVLYKKKTPYKQFSFSKNKSVSILIFTDIRWYLVNSKLSNDVSNSLWNKTPNGTYAQIVVPGKHYVPGLQQDCLGFTCTLSCCYL